MIKANHLEATTCTEHGHKSYCYTCVNV